MPKKKSENFSADKKIKKKRNKEYTDSESDHVPDDVDDCENIEDSVNNGVQSDTNDITLESPTLKGEILFCGGTNWDTVGRKQAPTGVKNQGGPNLWSPHRISTLKGLQVSALSVGCIACHCVAITAEGQGFTWGRNEKGQLGVGDTTRRNLPTLLENLTDHHLIAAACGKNHTLLLTNKGRVLSCGDNKMGQLGQGHQNPMIPSFTHIHYKGSPISKIACGGEFSMVVDISGSLYSFGCPEYGQLGNNTDGKYFVTSNKLSFKCVMQPRRVSTFIEKTRDGHIIPITPVTVKDIACGMNHTVILDNEKRIFTWGFGGYGRLGHSDPKDEMVPRLLKAFTGQGRGAVKIAAGSSFSMALNEYGALYLWGQTKSTGDANMYPKLLQDFNGWVVRDFSCSNRSIVVTADDSVISWGPSPTYGELGYGENKARSSTTPTELKTLPGVYVLGVSCGYAHTTMIVRNESEQDQNAIDSLPLYSP